MYIIYIFIDKGNLHQTISEETTFTLNVADGHTYISNHREVSPLKIFCLYKRLELIRLHDN